MPFSQFPPQLHTSASNRIGKVLPPLYVPKSLVAKKTSLTFPILQAFWPTCTPFAACAMNFVEGLATCFRITRTLRLLLGELVVAANLEEEKEEEKAMTLLQIGSLDLARERKKELYVTTAGATSGIRVVSLTKTVSH